MARSPWALGTCTRLPARGEAGRGPAKRSARAVPPGLRERGREEPRGGEGAVEHDTDPASAEAQAPAGRAESDEERLVRGSVGAQQKPCAQQRDDVGPQVDPPVAALPAHHELARFEVEVRKIRAVDLDRAQPLPHEEGDEGPVAGGDWGRTQNRRRCRRPRR